MRRMTSGWVRFQTSGGSPNWRPFANSIVPIAPSARIGPPSARRSRKRALALPPSIARRVATSGKRSWSTGSSGSGSERSAGARPRGGSGVLGGVGHPCGMIPALDTATRSPQHAVRPTRVRRCASWAADRGRRRVTSRPRAPHVRGKHGSPPRRGTGGPYRSSCSLGSTDRSGCPTRRDPSIDSPAAIPHPAPDASRPPDDRRPVAAAAREGPLDLMRRAREGARPRI